MHRADRDVVTLIEQTFLANGFNPAQGNWTEPNPTSNRCGLGSLLTSEQRASPFAHEIASSIIDRSEAWVGFFILAFDDWPALNDQVFGAGVYGDGEYNDRSRGYRAGWKCADRLFSRKFLSASAAA